MPVVKLAAAMPTSTPAIKTPSKQIQTNTSDNFILSHIRSQVKVVKTAMSDRTQDIEKFLLGIFKQKKTITSRKSPSLPSVPTQQTPRVGGCLIFTEVEQERWIPVGAVSPLREYAVRSLRPQVVKGPNGRKNVGPIFSSNCETSSSTVANQSNPSPKR